ncbi:MAG: hypothetical protein AAGA18_14500 [Verrucomicrobiota bacterium]
MIQSLNRRPDRTYLIEAGDQRFRVDLRRKEGSFEVAQVLSGRPGSHKSDADLGLGDPLLGGFREAVDSPGLISLLKLRPKPAREIAVLSDKITVVISNVDTLAGDNWQSTAEMEAQTLSGLSSSESVSASSRLTAEHGLMRAWTIQASMRDLASLRSTLTKEARGCRLISVGHPGGVRINAPNGQLESWPEFALFHAPGGERINLRSWNGANALKEALADPEVTNGLLPTHGPATILLATKDKFENQQGYNWLDLSKKEALATWAHALAKACDPLSGRILGMPLISVPKPPPSTTTLVASSAGFAAAILLILGTHYLLTKQSTTHLKEDLTALQAPAQKLASDNKRINELRTELKAIEEELTGVDNSNEIDVLAHRKRITALLQGVSSGATVKEAVILKISPDEGLDTVLSGVATTFNAPQGLARQIDENLASYGWRASLFRRTAKLLRDDGGPWSYEIRLTPGRPVLKNVIEKNDENNPDANKKEDTAGYPLLKETSTAQFKPHLHAP